MSCGDPLRVRDYLEHIAEAIANIRCTSLFGAARCVSEWPEDAGRVCVTSK